MDTRRTSNRLAPALVVLALGIWLVLELGAAGGETREPTRAGETTANRIPVRLDAGPEASPPPAASVDSESVPATDSPPSPCMPPRGRVRTTLLVVDHRRQQIPNVRFRCVPIGQQLPPEDPGLAGSHQSRFELWLDPGEYKLAVTAPRHRRFDDRLVIPPDVVEFGHEVVLVGDRQLFVVLERRSGVGPRRTSFTSDERARISLFATREEPTSRDVRSMSAAHVESGAWPRPGTDSGAGASAECLEWIMTLAQDQPLLVHVAFGDVIVATSRVAPGEARVHLVLDDEVFAAASARLRARVVDAASGAGVLGAVLEVEGRRAESDDRGEIVLGALSPGPVSWTLVSQHHEERRGQVVLGPGTTAELGTIALEVATAVEGRIVDEGGKPVDARVVLAADTDALDSLHEYAQSRTELELDSGRFRFERAGRRRYRLFVRDERWSTEPLHVDASGGDVHGIVVRVARGRRVRMRAGGLATAVLVVDERGSVACYDTLRSDVTFALPPGRYTMRAQFDAGVAERTFDCTGGNVIVEIAP